MNHPPDLYYDREQTWVKHDILRQYLLRLAVIVGNWNESITYIDCFSGPWENRSDNFYDTSFYIAIKQLQAARDELAKRPKAINLRCLFIEKKAASFAKLKEYSESIRDVEIRCIHGEMADCIGEISAFVKAGGSSNFPFVFIDPKGWGGFPMNKITPLLQFQPGEVLVNFMTSYIRRFIDQEGKGYSKSFDELFGHNQFRDELRVGSEQDREDKMVKLYGEELKKRGRFEHVAYTPVFKSEINAVHYHLIYATRHLKGLMVFKDEEKKAVKGMEEKRANAQQRKRQRGGEMELFSGRELHDTRFYDNLRDRYLEKLRSSLKSQFSAKSRILYDDLLKEALEIPLVWESDLKELLTDKKNQGIIAYEGLEFRQRVPKLGEENTIVVNENSYEDQTLL